jgi:glutathione S-transferase
MKLYWGEHTCAIGSHILLEESGVPYETEKIDVAGGGTQRPEFLAINPKGKVPALLRDDGSVLTEFGAIATWLARRFPDAALLPADPEREARALELLDYAVGTIHGQGFGRIFLTERFEPQDPVHQTLGLGSGSVKKQGREIVEQGFAIVAAQWHGGDWAVGDRFSIADAALFYCERWAPQVDIALPPPLADHLDRMKARPAVLKVMREWGEA